MRECNLMLNFQVYRRLLCHHSSLFDKLLGAQPEHALIDLTCEAHTFRLFFREQMKEIRTWKENNIVECRTEDKTWM